MFGTELISESRLTEFEERILFAAKNDETSVIDFPMCNNAELLNHWFAVIHKLLSGEIPICLF